MRRALNTEVEVVGGPYGQFRVLVDGEQVLDGGRLAALGVLPSARSIIDLLRDKVGDG